MGIMVQNKVALFMVHSVYLATDNRLAVSAKTCAIITYTASIFNIWNTWKLLSEWRQEFVVIVRTLFGYLSDKREQTTVVTMHFHIMNTW